MQLFAEASFTNVAQGIQNTIKQEVEGLQSDYLLGVNEAELADHLASKYSIDIVEINWDGMEATAEEKKVSMPTFGFRRGDSFDNERSLANRPVYTFHVPFTGDAAVLGYTPSTRMLWTTDITLGRGEFTFTLTDFADDGSRVREESQEVVKKGKQQFENLRPELERFNSSVRNNIAAQISVRKEELLRRAQAASGIGVPIRKAKGVSATFSIPATKKKLVIDRPKAAANPHAPEPTLDRAMYMEILGMIYDSGVQMERNPSLYKNFNTDKPRGEESLRDMFLMTLAPHFQSATGEAFNKGGKTDILIKHEKSNVFVAECKFWGGAKLFHETIDQLFGYLTWRESKACLMMFVDNKELTPVLKTIKDEAPKHGNFVKDKGQKKEGWMMYDFHLPGDNERLVEVAVMAFHFP